MKDILVIHLTYQLLKVYCKSFWKDKYLKYIFSSKEKYCKRVTEPAKDNKMCVLFTMM